jgi:hypothetical protein
MEVDRVEQFAIIVFAGTLFHSIRLQLGSPQQLTRCRYKRDRGAGRRSFCQDQSDQSRSYLVVRKSFRAMGYIELLK